ncbi:MAG: helix-turn-helix transcriptional regulator, partial [Actinomycetota bacterium]|nr:helix-turn-helix transcriptional regulator [Actinomycetota bacterium]
ADAAVAWRRRGDGRRSAAAQRRASSLSGRCEGAVTPALQGIETRGLLTPAERLVAQMAAAGRSNRDIAAELYLSVRTVENRLHRIYDKLGIAGRADLAAALQE